jgi:DNA-directed RNA polymerase subunit K/omega
MSKNSKNSKNDTKTEASDDEIVLDTEDVVEDQNEEIEEIDEIEEELELDETEREEQDFEENNLEDNDTLNDCIDIEEPEINISDTVIDDNKRTSKNKMTRYEFVRIIGERIMQLTKGAKPLIRQNKQSMELSYKEIAIEELKANMIPFKIRRFVKDHYEIWKIEELNKKHLEPLFY